MSYFWPVRTGITFFDYWTLSHAAFWFVYGSTVAANKLNRIGWLLIGLGAAISWEVFEKLAEKKWPDIWQSPESILNSFGSDLLCVGFAALAYWGFDKWRTR